MRPGAIIGSLACVLAVALAPAGTAGAMALGMKGNEIAPARDGDIAIRQELEAARKAGTVAAYDLFIARHAQHPLVEVARREREQRLRQARP